ncbi:hypothetical protein MBAV_001646 [Candidatus Magnetobacterium bavaricum]|uniref:Large polyvalent protein associated domain-containing protein n=1 Tax=Candidatus Magnetobacterium bavaricum TaxID=29290 RepID=A0A0F3GW78_9BACT|nr:hypothetical protein MBAV_001646 [Candidatus Magnetobacterium bavaricum]
MKYRVGASSTGSEEFNYVVYDDSAIKIASKDSYALRRSDRRSDSIGQLYDKVVADRKNRKPLEFGKFFRISLGKVSDGNAQAVKAATGIDLTGYERTIDNSFINHVLKRHGDPKTEAARGQLPITKEDIKRIPEIVESPDDIISGGKTKVGRDAILYKKRFNGETYYIEEVRTGKNQIAATTMYKINRGTSDMPSGQESPAHTSQTLPPTTSTVPQPGEPVKGTEGDADAYALAPSKRFEKEKAKAIETITQYVDKWKEENTTDRDKLNMLNKISAVLAQKDLVDRGDAGLVTEIDRKNSFANVPFMLKVLINNGKQNNTNDFTTTLVRTVRAFNLLQTGTDINSFDGVADLQEYVKKAQGELVSGHKPKHGILAYRSINPRLEGIEDLDPNAIVDPQSGLLGPYTSYKTENSKELLLYPMTDITTDKFLSFDDKFSPAIIEDIMTRFAGWESKKTRQRLSGTVGQFLTDLAHNLPYTKEHKRENDLYDILRENGIYGFKKRTEKGEEYYVIPVDELLKHRKNPNIIEYSSVATDKFVNKNDLEAQSKLEDVFTGIYNKKYNTLSLLDHLKNDPYFSQFSYKEPAIRELLDLILADKGLRNVLNKTNVRVGDFEVAGKLGGVYDIWNEAIEIVWNNKQPLNVKSIGGISEIVFHEAIHALTVQKMMASKKYTSEVRSLMAEAIKQRPGIVDQYGLKNEFEFMAEVFSNSTFVDMLKDMKTERKPSLLKKVWATISRILFGTDIHSNLFGNAIELGYKIAKEHAKDFAKKELAASPTDADAYAIAGPKAKGFEDAKKEGRTFKKDGLERFEIPSYDAKIIQPKLKASYDPYSEENTITTKLGKILDHPELYGNYPWLKDMNVVFENRDDDSIGYIKGHNIRLNSEYFIKGGTIDVDNPQLNTATNTSENNELDTFNLKQILMHEVQHAIQREEGVDYWQPNTEYEDLPSEKEARYIEWRSGLTPDRYKEYPTAADSYALPRTGDANVDAVLAKVSMSKEPDTTPVIERFKQWGHQFYTNFIDRYHPIKRAIDQLTQGAPVDIKDNPYIRASLYSGVGGQVDAIISKGTFDYNGPGGTFQWTGKGLKDIIEPVKDPDTYRKFTAYLIAKRAVDLKTRGITSGITDTDAQAVVAKYDTQFSKIADELYDFQDRVLTQYKDAGMLSQDMYDRFKALNKNYVPYFRVMETDTAMSAGKGLEAYQATKRIKGSERVIIDPIESVIKNTTMLTALAEKNKIGQALVNLHDNGIIDLPQHTGARFIEKFKLPMHAENVRLDEMMAALENVPEFKDLLDNGVITRADLKESATIFRSSFVNKPDVIQVFNDGKAEYYKVPIDVGRAWKSLDVEQVGMVVKWLGKASATLRIGATTTPEFFARNTIRDVMSVFVTSKYRINPKLLFEGFFDSAKESDMFWQWMATGGAQSMLGGMDRDALARTKYEMMAGGNVGKTARGLFLKRAIEGDLSASDWADLGVGIIKTPIEAVRVMGELSEQMTRIANFRAGLKVEGQTEEGMMKAAYNTRDSLDFARAGAKMAVMNKLIAFFNANLQGIDKTIRTLVFNSNTRERNAAIFRAFSSMTLASVALAVLNQDDERYHSIPQAMRDQAWIIPTDKNVWRIPKPFEMGIVFASVPERIVEYMYTHDTAAFDKLRDSVMQAFVPNVIPTVAAPFIEAWSNKSLFTGRQIIPEARKHMLPQHQYTPHGTELAKAVSAGVAKTPEWTQSIPGVGQFRKMAASPALTENLVRSWSGGAGMSALGLADKAAKGLGLVESPPVRPAKTLSDMPLVKGFTLRYPSSNTENMQAFYESHDMLTQLRNSYKMLVNQGKHQEARKLLADNGRVLLNTDPMRTKLMEMHRHVDSIYNSKVMSPDVKRQQIDETYRRMDMMAKQFNAVIRRAQQQKAKAS